MDHLAAWLHLSPWPPEPDWLFWAALALVGGALLGEAAFRWLGLPRIAGYSAAGMVVAAAGLGLDGGPLQGPLLGPLRLVVDLALALLLFELGSRVSIKWLLVNPALLWTSVLESTLSFAAVTAALLYLDHDLVFALAGAALMVSASGAVIGRVASELRSSGQVTERMIVFSALNTLYAVLALKMVSGWAHVELRGDWIMGVSQTLYTLAGSILLAALLSQGVVWVLRRFEMGNENTVLLLLGLLLLGLVLARMLGLSTLLVPLLAGVALRNASPRPCIWPRHFGTAGGVLVLMLFVVLGLTWSVDMLKAGALAALAVLAARWLAKAVVMVGMARLGGLQERQGLGLALAMAPLSATTLVLLADLQVTHPDLALRLTPMALSALAAMAIVGPIAVQWGLHLGREYLQAEPSVVKVRA